MLRVTTWNVNGLRAALRKGFADWLEAIDPDVLLLQEVRARPEQLPDDWATPPGWHVTWHPAERLGYAGTAAWTREPHDVLGRGVPLAPGVRTTDDPEGRVLRVRCKGMQFVSLYLPSGSQNEQRQQAKEAWMAEFAPFLARLRKSRLPTIVAGDFNIAHTERDIFYATGNAKTSGFLPHEREWISDQLATGWRDVVREEAGDVDGPYSWWSNRGQARVLDRGWRIDYHLANAAAAKRVVKTETHREAGLACSDHAPVTVTLKV